MNKNTKTNISKELVLIELFKLINIKKELIQHLEHFFNMVVSNIAEDSYDEKEVTSYKNEMFNIIEENYESLVPLVMNIYSKHFTKQELQGLLSFYQTRVGKKFITTMPKVTYEIMEVSNKWGKSVKSLL